MNYFIIVEIQDTITGLSACYLDTYDYVDGEGVEYIWSDGNFGCDCNRSLCLNQALGGSNWGAELFPELPCNNGDNVLRIEVRERGTGRVIYTDMEHKDDFLCPLPNT